MTSPDNEVLEFRSPALFSVKQACERLHGSEYTVPDINRMYHAIQRGEIAHSKIGERKFIPAWQVEKLANKNAR